MKKRETPKLKPDLFNELDLAPGRGAQDPGPGFLGQSLGLVEWRSEGWLEGETTSGRILAPS